VPTADRLGQGRRAYLRAEAASLREENQHVMEHMRRGAGERIDRRSGAIRSQTRSQTAVPPIQWESDLPLEWALRGSSSVGRTLVSKTRSRGFESSLPRSL
jgi:hypothetical protein